jgi:hypothetical protein
VSFLKGNTAIDFSSCSFGLDSVGIKKYPRIISDNKITDPVMIFVLLLFRGTDTGLRTSFGTS